MLFPQVGHHTKGELMKRVTFVSTLIIASLFWSLLGAQSGGGTTWTKAKAKTWFEKKEWLAGKKLQSHKSIDELTFAVQYHLHPSLWDSAFAFLRRTNLPALPKGKYTILGDSVFASVTEDSTKNVENSRWESHRRYADIQYVIRGEEKIGICPVANASVTQAYDAKNDVARYTARGTQYVAHPGTFFIFFPTDAHRPSITTGENKVDKKLVIKVRVTGYEER